MSDDLSQELADLTADLKAIILDARSRGVEAFPTFQGERTQPAPEEARPTSSPRPRRAPVAARPASREARAPTERPKAGPEPEVVQPIAPIERSRLYGTDSEALLAVRAELGACERCGLCKGRTNLVFGTGDPDADLMIIGEAPGAQEDRKGLPFVGPAGQMLDNMLRHVLGLERSDVYISNVVKCRPPNNRTPEPEEIATCRPFLMRQVEAVKPKVILSLGRPAAQTLLETSRGITSLRGQWAEVGGTPLLPTFHPAYLLRKPQDKRLVFQDLKALKERYDQLGGSR
ncbi:MAG: uracil-DNA glycosylase family protein [Myxococcota bacterium]|nr:uracil-DNA glycosylase family protein [Myxococcota bacterium]